MGRGGGIYGAAGSLVLLLIWVYYSAQILFFGAELTQVYARRHGSRLGLPETESASAAHGGTAPSAKDAGRVVPGKKDSGRRPEPARPEPARGPEPARPAAAARIDPEMLRLPTSAIGRGLAFSVALLLLGFINKKKAWPG